MTVNRTSVTTPNAIGIVSEMSVFPTGPCSIFILFMSDFCWFIRSFQSNTVLHDGYLLIVQTVELIDYLIDQCVGALNAGE